MPLIVSPDGTITEGAVPAGGATVLVLDNGVVKEAFFEPQVVGGGGGGDTVGRERLTYDLPERVPAQVLRDVLAIRSNESVPPQIEEVIAALLVRAEETNPTPVETIRTTVRPMISELVPGQTDLSAVAVRANETVTALTDKNSLEMTTGEAVPAQTEVVRIDVRANALESVQTITDNNSAAVIEQDNTVPMQIVVEPVSVNLTGYANAVVANTTWTNPNNALGNTTGTAATLTATASGLAGTTNNTATGSITLGFQDVNLGDLIISNVDLFVENQGATAGVAVAQPTTNIAYQYSLDGTNFTTFFTHNTPALAKGIRTIDVTALVGQDNAKLSALQIRATGSVTSGTGLGAANTASFFRAWLVVNAARTY